MSFSVRLGRPRPILDANDSRLRRIAKRVQPSALRDPLFIQLIADMFATVKAHHLIGMAAPQIGVLQRVIVIDFTYEGEQHGPFALINPQITVQEGDVLSTEGSPCLPGESIVLHRSEHVICHGLHPDGQRATYDARGLLAICLQHEIDHLNGRLISDYAKLQS